MVAEDVDDDIPVVEMDSVGDVQCEYYTEDADDDEEYVPPVEREQCGVRVSA